VIKKDGEIHGSYPEYLVSLSEAELLYLQNLVLEFGVYKEPRELLQHVNAKLAVPYKVRDVYWDLPSFPDLRSLIPVRPSA